MKRTKRSATSSSSSQNPPRKSNPASRKPCSSQPCQRQRRRNGTENQHGDTQPTSQLVPVSDDVVPASPAGSQRLKRDQSPQRPLSQLKLEILSSRKRLTNASEPLSNSESSEKKILGKARSKRQANGKVKKEVKNTPKKHGQAGSRKDVEGYCPCCQMPFEALVLDSPETHVAECLSKPGSSANGTHAMPQLLWPWAPTVLLGQSQL